MIGVEWTHSILPHRCKECSVWIRRGARHVRLFNLDGTLGRFCGPHCARCYVRGMRKQQKADEEDARLLRRIVLE